VEKREEGTDGSSLKATSDSRCRSWINPYPWETSHRPCPQCILVLLLLVLAFFTHAQSYFKSPSSWVTSAAYQYISTTASQDEAPLDDWHLVCTVLLNVFQLPMLALADQCSHYHDDNTHTLRFIKRHQHTLTNWQLIGRLQEPSLPLHSTTRSLLLSWSNAQRSPEMSPSRG